MSARYPDVPNLPGVPTIARADALLGAIRIGSSDTLNSGLTALSSLGLGDIGSATSSLGSALTTAGATLPIAQDVFSAGSAVVSGLSGAASNASSAIAALSSGDIAGAIAPVERLIDQAQTAYSAVLAVINPPAQDALAESGGDVEADMARQWGLFTQGGELMAPADNVLVFESTLDARISDYPVENGGFGSYNKVRTPNEVRMIMSRGGSVEDRQAFVKAVELAWLSTELFIAVSPEVVYLDMNVVGVHRQAAADRGVGLMVLELVLRKVRQTATLAFTSTKEPTGQETINAGSVQAKPTVPPVGAVK